MKHICTFAVTIGEIADGTRDEAAHDVLKEAEKSMGEAAEKREDKDNRIGKTGPPMGVDICESWMLASSTDSPDIRIFACTVENVVS